MKGCLLSVWEEMWTLLTMVVFGCFIGELVFQWLGLDQHLGYILGGVGMACAYFPLLIRQKEEERREKEREKHRKWKEEEEARKKEEEARKKREEARKKRIEEEKIAWDKEVEEARKKEREERRKEEEAEHQSSSGG